MINHIREAVEDLTGGVTTAVHFSDILDRERFWKQELLNVNQKALYACSTGDFGGVAGVKGIYQMHAYSILKAVEESGERLLLVRFVVNFLNITKLGLSASGTLGALPSGPGRGAMGLKNGRQSGWRNWGTALETMG